MAALVAFGFDVVGCLGVFLADRLVRLGGTGGLHVEFRCLGALHGAGCLHLAFVGGFGFVPFGGGHGGNGGNGGDGSYAIFIERKEAKVVANRKCAIKGGVGGKAGKGSKANPNYWLWSGSCGEDGKDGKNQKACNNPDRLIYV